MFEICATGTNWGAPKIEEITQLIYRMLQVINMIVFVYIFKLPRPDATC